MKNIFSHSYMLCQDYFRRTNLDVPTKEGGVWVITWDNVQSSGVFFWRILPYNYLRFQIVETELFVNIIQWHSVQHVYFERFKTVTKWVLVNIINLVVRNQHLIENFLSVYNSTYLVMVMSYCLRDYNSPIKVYVKKAVVRKLKIEPIWLVKENLWLTDNVFEDWFNVNFSYEQAYAKELGDQDCNVDISLYEWTSKMKISF